MRTFLLTTMTFLYLLSGLSALARANDKGFVGSEACSHCHSAETKLWRGSDHDMAMQHANDSSVAGNFNNTTFSANGVTSRFFKKDGKFWINTDGADGKLQDFKIAYTFGVYPLQQYLVAFPDGRIQALGIAWDTRLKSAGGQRWFHLYPDQHITAGDSLHWTSAQQNWNYMCADCHSTHLLKGYSSANDSFKTTWSDINVGCEACHGPGEQHLNWAGADKEHKTQDSNKGLTFLLGDTRGVDWVMNPVTGMAARAPARSANKEIGLCAACHSRRGELKAGIESDASFLDHYRPALLSDDLYHVDGQIREEVYVWGSFVQSKMYSKGVTCSDCHEPHSLKLRAQLDQVCSQCHLPSRFASSKHHHHKQGSAGAACVDCHMPQTTYMVVDPRRDHSLRVPRPDLSLEFATPNACNQCHQDQSTQWAADNFAKMWPGVSKPFQNWSRAFTLARSGAPQAEVALINVVMNNTTPDIARATALEELAAYLSPLSGKILQRKLADKSPLVRMAALDALATLPPENRYTFAKSLLRDPVLAVRIDAARISAPALRNQLAPDELGVLQSAIKEYIKAQNFNAERPESRLNLGNLYAQAGAAVDAEKAFREALKINAKFGPAYANLADLYRSQGQEKLAASILHQGIAALPEDATLYYSMGLLQARQQQTELAVESLKKAAILDPRNARYAYVYGVALNSSGKHSESLQVLENSSKKHPENREIIYMVASIYRDLERYEAATIWAEKLLAINPGDQNAAQLIESIKALKTH